MPMIKHPRLLSYLIWRRGVHHADAIMSLPIAEENFISICFHYFPTVGVPWMDGSLLYEEHATRLERLDLGNGLVVSTPSALHRPANLA